MSKSRCDLPKNARLQVILSVLEIGSKEEGLTTSEIASIVSQKGINVSIRTILRDLNELSSFPSLTDEIRDGSTYWIWIPDKERKISLIDDMWRKHFIDFLKTEEKFEELV